MSDTYWIPVRTAPEWTEPRSRPPSLAITYLLLLGLCLIGIALSWVEHKVHEEHEFLAKLAEHGASAFIVAAAIGLSYELVLHNKREAQFERLFKEHRQKTFEAFSAFLTLTSSQVFVLLEDIATQVYEATQRTPTLYRPSREQQSEYVFTDNADYFDTLLEVNRKDVLKVLARWINPNSKRGVKFLGSDFIGKYRLHDLAEELNKQATYKLKEWSTISDEDKGWVLNFVWAASRCEKDMYSQLAQLIRATPHEEIREWILFIPRQMKDIEFLRVIRSFLEREEVPSDNEIALVVRGLGELYSSAEQEVRDIFHSHRRVFSTDAAREEIRKSWGTLQLSSERVLKLVQDSTGTNWLRGG